MTEADLYEKSTSKLVGEHRPTLLSGLQFRAMLTKSGSERVELACFSPAR